MEHKGGHWYVLEKCIACTCDMPKGTPQAEMTLKSDKMKRIV